MSFYFYMRPVFRALVPVSPADLEHPVIAYLYNADRDEWRQFDFNSPGVRSSLPYWQRFSIGPKVVAFMAGKDSHALYNNDQHAAAMSSLARLRAEYERMTRKPVPALPSTRLALPEPDLDVMDAEILEPDLLPL